jgi:peptide/nickel transport system substrate-binding protein
MNRTIMGAALAVILVVAACGSSESPPSSTTPPPASPGATSAPASSAAASGTSSGSETPSGSADLLATTPAGTQPVDTVIWNLSGGEPGSLDPITFFNGSTNYPLANMCESVMLAKPDGTVEPYLAASTDQSDPTRLVLNLRDATFWDGTPVTAEDAVYSLTRAWDKEFSLGSGYADVFGNVTAIEKTGDRQVTISLKQPDYLLLGRLSSAAGAVYQETHAKEAGKAFGTPDGGLMCTGPFKFGTWAKGDSLTINRNDAWWGAGRFGTPLVKTLKFTFVTDAATYTAAMLSGSIDGQFEVDGPAVDQLRAQGQPVILGRSMLIGELSPTNLATGILGDKDLRNALALAMDYEGLKTGVFGGLGDLPRAQVPPYLGGAQQPIYEAAYAKLPEPKQDVEAAKALVAKSGVTNPKIVIAVAQGIQEQTSVGLAVKDAAEKIGIAAEIREVSLDEFGQLYVPGTDLGKQVDIYFLTDSSIVADPLAFYSYVGLPEGYGNWSGYENDEVVAILRKAGAEPDPAKRAELATQAQALLVADNQFIPLLHRWNATYLRPGLTGAVVAAPSTIFAPWAVTLGGE